MGSVTLTSFLKKSFFFVHSAAEQLNDDEGLSVAARRVRRRGHRNADPMQRVTKTHFLLLDLAKINDKFTSLDK